MASLAFVAPLLLIYEGGALGSRAARNGADAWLRQTLDLLGFSQYFLLPALVIFALLGWHHVSRRPWRIGRGVLWGMFGESILLAISLRLLLQLQIVLREELASAVRLDLAGWAGAMSGYLGAGIYEELLFRLLMLPLAVWLLRRMSLGSTASLIAAVLLTSLLFAAAHNIGPFGERFAWFTFLFRFLAGIFFAVLFVFRGFGIAVGAHAGYDILVALTRV